MSRTFGLSLSATPASLTLMAVLALAPPSAAAQEAGRRGEDVASPPPSGVALMLAAFNSVPPGDPTAGAERAMLLTHLAARGLDRRGDVRFAGVRGPRAVMGEVAPAYHYITVMVTHLGMMSRLDVRVIDITQQDGRVVAQRMVVVPGELDLLRLARSVVREAVAILRPLSLALAAWSDPLTSDALEGNEPSGVASEALAAYARGVRAESEGDVESARAAFREAVEKGGEEFVEARVASER